MTHDEHTDGSGTFTDVPVIDFSEPAPHRRMSRARSRHSVIAGTLAMVLAAGGGIALMADDGATPSASSQRLPKLALGALGRESAALSGGADKAMAPAFNLRYVHDGAWPGVPATAPVYRLDDVTLTDSQVNAIASALGMKATATKTDDGWKVSDSNGDGTATELMVMSSGGGTSLSYYRSMWLEDKAVGGEGVSGSGGASTSGDDSSVSSPPTTYPPTEPTMPPAPANLPSESDAKAIAKRLVEAIDGEAAYEYEVLDNAATVSVASTDCPEDARCIAPDIIEPSVTYSRSVMAHRLIDGKRVNGLSWSMEIGDNGVVQSLYGTVATLTHLGDYPLREVEAVFADLQSGEYFNGLPMPAVDDRMLGDATDGSDTLGGATKETPSNNGTDPNTAVDSGTIVVDPDLGVKCEALTPECVGVPEPMPIDPGTTYMTEPVEPVEVTVDGVTVSHQVWYGVDGSQPVAYVVPMYSFSGTAHWQDAPSDWSMDMLALDQSYIQSAPPTTTDTTTPIVDTVPPNTTEPTTDPTPVEPPTTSDDVSPGDPGPGSDPTVATAPEATDDTSVTTGAPQP